MTLCARRTSFVTTTKTPLVTAKTSKTITVLVTYWCSTKALISSTTTTSQRSSFDFSSTLACKTSNSLPWGHATSSYDTNSWSCLRTTRTRTKEWLSLQTSTACCSLSQRRDTMKICQTLSSSSSKLKRLATSSKARLHQSRWHLSWTPCWSRPATCHSLCGHFTQQRWLNWLQCARPWVK